MFKTTIFLILIPLFLGSCSSQYVVTFDSNPKGASLVCNNKNWGYTPKKLYYDESVKKQPYINVSDCSANWISGVRKNYPSSLTVYPEGGTIITLDRPNSGDYVQDAEFALKVQNMRYQKRQAEAAEENAQANRDAAYEASRAANAAQDRAFQERMNYLLRY